MNNSHPNAQVSLKEILSDPKPLSISASFFLLLAMILPIKIIGVGAAGFFNDIIAYDAIGWNLLGLFSLIPIFLFLMSATSITVNTLNRYANILSLLAISSLSLIPIFYIQGFMDGIHFYESLNNTEKKYIFGNAHIFDIYSFYFQSLITLGDASFIVATILSLRSFQTFRSKMQ